MARAIRLRVWVLGGLMLGTMTVSGMFHYDAWILATTNRGIPFLAWPTVVGGLGYSVPMLGIILAHEAGHMWGCERHGLTYGGPYCLPVPLAITGTFGAILRVRGPYPSRQALFDIAAAGPIVGFIASLACVLAGIAQAVPMSHQALASPIVRLWEPVLVRALLPEGMAWPPLLIAGWVGLLFQMGNLLPYGQFDGGHIVTALWGQTVARRLSWVLLLFVTGFCIVRPSLTWLVVGAVMVASGVGGVVPQRSEPTLSIGRRSLAAGLVGLLVLAWARMP